MKPPVVKPLVLGTMAPFCTKRPEGKQCVLALEHEGECVKALEHYNLSSEDDDGPEEDVTEREFDDVDMDVTDAHFIQARCAATRRRR